MSERLVMAPDLILEGTDGPCRLRPQLGHKLLIIFYQEDGTPTCTTELTSFRDDFSLITELNADVVAVSTDSLDSHRAFLERIGSLPYPLLSDSDGSAAEGFGVLDAESRRALRAAFVIDASGTVVYASVPYNPNNLTEYESVFRALGYTS